MPRPKTPPAVDQTVTVDEGRNKKLSSAFVGYSPSKPGEDDLPPSPCKNSLKLPQNDLKKSRKAKRIGFERAKHNASERKRKLHFNAKLEELRVLIPNLSPSASKRQILEGAIGFLQLLLAERSHYQQNLRDAEQRFVLALHNQQQQQQHQLQQSCLARPPLPSPAPIAIPSPSFPSASGGILPPLHVVLSQDCAPSMSSFAPYQTTFCERQ
ncbi:hypothetical protein QOT17_004957 [Balamuthia mandrillaris]